MIAPGERVGAFYALGRTRAVLFGYGLYEGEFTPPEDIMAAAGPVALLGITLPRLKLDDGTVIWGCECWWGPEAEVKGMLSTVRQSTVRVETLRRRLRARWDRACQELDQAEAQLP